MSISILPDDVTRTGIRGAPRGAVIVCSLLLILLPAAQSSHAQPARAQRAIEKLENCSEQERKSGCVEILKVERGEGDKQRIKAQLRGGRIIWYEFDRESGKARRTN